MWSQGMLERVNRIAIKEIRKSPSESAEVKFVLHAGLCIFSMYLFRELNMKRVKYENLITENFYSY